MASRNIVIKNNISFAVVFGLLVFSLAAFLDYCSGRVLIGVLIAGVVASKEICLSRR